MVRKLGQFKKLGHFSFLKCLNLVSIFCRVLKMKIIILISLAIPRPLRSGINWPINFSNKIYDSVYFQQQKKAHNWREEKGHFSFVNCPNFVIIFCQVLKISFFDIPINPPSVAVRNSLTNQFFQKNWRFCIFSKKKLRTSLNSDIHPGDSSPYRRGIARRK